MRVACYFIYALLAAMLLTSCGPSKAAVDYTMSESIIWPGPPEKPRIKYLWSMRNVRGGQKSSSFVRFVTGEIDYDISDPQNSDVLVAPHGVYLGPKDMLYVADPGASRVSVVNLQNMESFNILGVKGQNLMAPIGVVAVPDGRIFISDADLAKVAIFNEKGKFTGFLSGEFKRPTGLAINPTKGIIYVADTWEHVVYAYNLEGERIGTIGRRGEGDGKLNYPTHVAVDSSGNLYVSDTLNFMVQIFSPAGKFINSFGVVGDQFGNFDKIKGISVDTEGHIYVVDSGQDMVKIFDRTGRLLLFFGRKGHYYGEFYLPSGVYVDGSNRIFVTDSLNMRIQVFQFLGGD